MRGLDWTDQAQDPMAGFSQHDNELIFGFFKRKFSD